MWPGWKAWVDGEPVSLTGLEWLEVPALAGKHTYLFRYRPWDVLMGGLLSLLGVILAVYIWRAAPPPSTFVSVRKSRIAVPATPANDFADGGLEEETVQRVEFE